MRFSAWLLVAMLGMVGCDVPSAKTTLSGKAMGTTWTISLRGIRAAPSLQGEIEQTLDAWEQALSRWRDDSALAAFNRSQSTEWQDVDARLAKAVATAKAVAEQTEGALDITIAPLVKLWGFDAKGPPTDVPSMAQISEKLKQCGWDRVEVSTGPPRLRKKIPGLTLNVDAVAEGLAVDEIAEWLVQGGHKDFLINLGGEVLAKGGPWQVGIQMPEAPQGQAFTIVELHNEALATSGIYRQNFERAGHRYSHILDPRTGSPIQGDLASVSVIAPSCTQADAWATALLVLGREKGDPIANRSGMRVVWIEGK